MQRNKSSFSLYSRLVRLYLILFLLLLAVTIVGFSILRLPALRSAQQAEASTVIIGVADIFENKNLAEIDTLLPSYLNMLSANLLFNCLRLRLEGVEQEFVWPAAECTAKSDPKRFSNLQVPLKSSSKTASAINVSYTLNQESLATTYQTEIVTIMIAAIIFGLLSLVLLRFSFSKTIEQPLDKFRNDLRSAVAARSLAHLDGSHGSSEMAAIASSYKEMLDREQGLLEEQTYRRAIIDQAFDCVITIDRAGIIIDFNPAAEQTFGFKRNEVIGRKLVDTIIPVRYQAAHEKGIARYLSTHESHVIGSLVELEAQRADGSEIPVEISITAVSTGDVEFFTAYLRDISERKAQQGVLLQAKEEAELANQAKSQFLATMSHEIRSPLNTILGSINLLEGTKLTNSQRKYLRVSKAAGKSLLSHINDILDMARIEAGHIDLEPSWFLVRPLIEDVVDVFEFNAKEKETSIESKVAPEVPDHLYGDVDRIRQVLFNLVGNAIKFTERGSVSVKLESIVTDALYRFTVTDSGAGIPEHQHAEVFEAFKQVDSSLTRRHEGSGLGLAICQRLVEAMSGKIDFQSTLGKGSSFWFELDLEGHVADEPLPELNTESVEVSPLKMLPNESNYRLLLAEDSAPNQFVLQTYLELAGYQVDAASTGVEALELTNKFPYDAILMDISMPEMDGIEATRHLRSRQGSTSTIPIIALTAHALPEIRNQCVEAGMTGFLTKPVSRDELLNTLERILGEKSSNSLNI